MHGSTPNRVHSARRAPCRSRHWSRSVVPGAHRSRIHPGPASARVTPGNVHLTSVNGEDLDHLVNRPVVDGRVISFPVTDGTMLKDGRFTNFLPVRVTADLGINAHIVTPSLTYGLTRDLDVNMALPILRTALDVETRCQIPDPRLPRFALPAGSPLAGTEELTASAGIGDLLLRAKYLCCASGPSTSPRFSASACPPAIGATSRAPAPPAYSRRWCSRASSATGSSRC